MGTGLHDIDWAGLRHNRGSAEDLPGLLDRCAGPAAKDAGSAADELRDLLYHQGGWICSAAPAALPFVLRLAATPRVRSRVLLLELVATLAAEAGRVKERFLDPGWAPAWDRALPELTALLQDPEPEVRRAAAHALGVCGSPGELVLPALLHAWEAEHDAATRLELVLTLGRVVPRTPAGAYRAQALDLLRALVDDPDSQVRLAAVHASAATDPALPARRLDVVLDAVRHPSVGRWRRTSSVGTNVTGVLHWTSKLLPGPSPAFALGVLADHPDGEQRIAALAVAGGLLAGWRSPADALLPRLVARLDDPDAEVRFRAVELLACLGPAAAAHADDVAAVLTDGGVRATRLGEGVGEAALWALARMDDERCLPGLLGLLAGAPSGFATHPAHYPADFHHVVLPSLPEALSGFASHAELLVPAVCDRIGTLTDPHQGHRYGELLAGWGPAAESAVPRLLVLLEDERTWTAAARALAGIGAAGEAAGSLLRSRIGAGGPEDELAAWAYWRVGGDPGPALALLGREPERPPGLAELRQLADLGPHAAPFADRLAALAAGNHVWTRVEAAHALWATVGDTERSVAVLTAAVRELAAGRHQPAAVAAVRYLARIGPAARPAADLLRDIRDRDERMRSAGAWRAFTQDEDVRAAVRELLAAASF
ncbi:HEAT repeat domain-containing protein [Streptomyces sp. NPDC060194]|uniref:HEAT repeat domain-containing protein n=1 Tax=Streptomyces sp. NPDC060194 TaxID=3347069 RepID=UPI00365C74F7